MSEFDEKDTMTAETENISSASPLSEENYSPVNEGTPVMGPETFDGTGVISGVEVAKRSPMKIVAVIAAVVIALFALSGAAYALVPQVRNFVRSTFTSDSSYYSWVEEQNLNKGTDDFTEALDKAKDITSANMKLEIKPDNDGITKLMEAQGGNLGGMKLPEIGVDAKSAQIDGVTNENIAVSANGEQLVSANAYIKDGKIYYQVPELSADYICYDTAAIIDKALETGRESGNLDENGEKAYEIFKGLMGNMTGKDGELISTKDLNTLIKRYGSVIFDNITNVEKETGVEVEADGIKSKYTKLTAKIDAGTVFHIAKEAMTELTNDSIIKDIAVEKFGVAEDKYDEAIDTLKKQIDQYDEVSGGKVYLTMDIYVNSRGDIVGRAFNLDTTDDNNTDNDFHEDSSIGYFITNDGDNYGYSIFADIEGKRYALDGNAEKDGDKYTGKASLTLGEKKDIISISYEDLERVDDKFIEGKLTIGLANIGFDDITIEFDEDDETQHIKSDITYSGTKLLSIAAEYNSKDPESITVFNDSAKVYGLDEIQSYIQSIDKSKLEEFGKNLFKAMGMTDEQIAQMTGGQNLGDKFSDEIGKLSENGGDILLTGGNLLSGNNDIIDGGDDILTPDTDITNDISESSDAGLGDDSDIVEVKYDFSKIKVQFDGKDIVLPCKIDGIEKLVKFDTDKLEAKYGYASGFSDDYSLTVSLSNKTDKEVDVKDGVVSHISVSDSSTHKLTIDGIGCGDDIQKAAEKYGITLEDPKTGFAEITSTDGYNYISIMYSEGKIWNISISMYD